MTRTIILLTVIITLITPKAFALNHALSLDGDGDYVEIKDSLSLNTLDSQVTLEAWIKPTAFPNQWMPLIYKGDKRTSDAYENWNIARTPEELLATMTTSLTGKEAGLVGYWTFEGQAENVIDATGNGHDGKLVGDAKRVLSELPTSVPKLFLSADGLKNNGTVWLFGGWKYHPGDNAAWARKEFDDSSWETTDTWLNQNRLPKSGWTGIGWFRLHLAVDSTLWNTPLALNVNYQAGASEIYLDGELIYQFGQVGASKAEEKAHWEQNPKVILFGGNQTEHILAVRYSNFSADAFNKGGQPAGFGVFLSDANHTIEQRVSRIRRDTSEQMFFTGVLLAFALLHLLLFLFYPRSIENLYYAIFTGFLAATVFTEYQKEILPGLEVTLRILTILTVVSGMRFGYSLFYPKLPKQFLLFATVGIGLGVWTWYNYVRAYPYTSWLVLVILAEMVRVMLVAILKKKDGAWMLGIGFLVFGIVVTYEQLIDIHLLGPLIKGIDNPSYYGALGLLISMSVYLARNFAKTSKNLETQLVQVKELSQKTLEQERRAKALEFERHLLEQEQRAREVLEAKNAELERAYGDLKRTQAELVQSEKMAGLGQIVAGVAHEINNPVNFISSALPALERDLHVILQLFDELDQVYELNLPQLSPLLQRVDALAAELDYQAARAAIPQILLAMREGTERTTEIIKSLRIFARHGGSGKAPVDIHAGLEATLTLLQNRFKKGIVVNQNYGNLPQVECDAGQINQVFMNLLTNAADAMSDKGELFITTRQAGEYVEIRVRDTGCGIPDEIKGKIFEPFFTTKQVGSGMGLGLWICYQIVVEGHEGKIEVESDIGVGTEFVITLPIHSKAGHTSP